MMRPCSIIDRFFYTVGRDSVEQLHNGFTLELCEGAFPLSTDSIALSHFAKLPKNARVLDLGSGCGTLGLLLCANDPNCCVDGIELDPNAHQTALKNCCANALDGRLNSICADLNGYPDLIKAGAYHCCISNPPYFSHGPQSKTVPLARRDDACSMEVLFSAAARALKYGGDFFLVHRPEKFAQICACAAAVKLEPKKICLLRHRPDDPVSLILVQCRKGGKPGLSWQEECLYDRQGLPTDYYRTLYHI